MFSFFSRAPKMPSAAEALPGRAAPSFTFEDHHAVLGRPLTLEAAPGAELIVGLGCFWGAERRFWTQPGVLTTAVGYAGGLTPNPTYKEVCSGLTGHNEVVRVVFDPTVTSLAELLRVFWESHDPTQGFRQGNDVGTQYRSGLYLADPAQRAEAEASRHSYQRALAQAGLGVITTEILDLPAFYYAEDYHQQYLHKNPGGYCGLGGTGVGCPVGLAAGGTLR